MIQPTQQRTRVTPSATQQTNAPFPGRWWHRDDGRIVCDLCPRECSLREGASGFCFVRQNVGGQMVLNTYGHSTGFCIDPVEKKSLNHFYPGTSVLSFGTAGCNLGCKFCQAWEMVIIRRRATWRVVVWGSYGDHAWLGPAHRRRSHAE